MIMRRIFNALTVYVLGCCLGCSTSEHAKGASSQRGLQKSVVNVVVEDEAYTSGFPARLKVVFGHPAIVDIGVDVSRDGKRWGFAARIDPNKVGEDVIGGEVSNGAIKDGTMNLTQKTGEAPVQASSGSWQFTVKNGRIQGSVTVTSVPDLSAVLDGEISIECWVPQSQVGAPPPGTSGTLTSADGVESLILDTELKSAFCQKVQPWTLAK